MKIQFKLCFVLLIYLNAIFLKGQKITFNKDIAPIIHQNCSPCHRSGESAPFELISYKQVKERAKFIKKVTEIRYMPPWPATHDFGDFKNERYLTDNQIELIKKWVETGATEGPKKLKPKNLVFANETLLPFAPDLSLKIKQPYKIASTNKEEFIMFSLPTNLPEDKKIKAIEYRPSNKKLVHHSRVSIDTTHIMRIVDAKSIDDPTIAEFSKVGLREDFWYGWVPGNYPIIYPKGTAKILNKDADLLVNLHFAPNIKENEYDQSTINLFFETDSIEHEIKTAILAENYIQNGPFVIKPDTIITFYSRTEPLSYPINIISVQPHMHLLGKSLKAYIITPDGDLIPLIKIDKWDFNFQQTYEYKDIQKVPIGSVIYFEATFDNTAANPRNPNRPSKTISYGWETTKEMMDLIIQYYK